MARKGTAMSAGVLALLGSLAMGLGSFDSLMESANTKPYEPERKGMLDALVCVFGLSAVLLFFGGVLLLIQLPIGRGLVVAGCVVAVAAHALGVALVLNPAEPIVESFWPRTFVLLVILLAFPLATMWCALAGSTGRWLDEGEIRPVRR